ncbi:hypothetical protein C0993_011170 [Termitomyces sp. T159_Od127]|nr:hypothetical protein C0993_011170 [Termitomyces sp. T159_Od127]
MAITVKWGKEKIAFDLPAPDTPLYVVRHALADYTHLPVDAFKLIHAGAIMKDDNAPISAYHLSPNATIVLVGAADNPSGHTSPSERSVLATIQSELSAVRSALQPSLQAFLVAPADPKEHTRLGELLLQSLLRLDGIVAEPSWQQARSQRKDAVREVQDMLDRLDNAWATRSV